MKLEITEWEQEVLESLVMKHFQDVVGDTQTCAEYKHEYFLDLKRLLLKLQDVARNIYNVPLQ